MAERRNNNSGRHSTNSGYYGSSRARHSSSNSFRDSREDARPSQKSSRQSSLPRISGQSSSNRYPSSSHTTGHAVSTRSSQQYRQNSKAYSKDSSSSRSYRSNSAQRSAYSSKQINQSRSGYTAQRTINNYTTSQNKRGIFFLLGQGIIRFFSSVFNFVSSVFGKTAGLVLKIILIVLIMFGVFICIDAIRYRGKVFPNVSVGTVNIGGMDLESAEKAIDNYYAPLMASNSITIYASEQARQISKSESDSTGIDSSSNGALMSSKTWVCSATDIGAAVPSQTLATEALQLGRENGGLLTRLLLLIIPKTIDVYGDYNKTSFEGLASDIDATIGEAREDSYVTISDGTATAHAGHDGFMINRDELLARLNIAFLTENPDESQSSFVAKAECFPQRITKSQAEDAATRITDAISQGASFDYQGKTWTVDNVTLGDWTTTEIVEDKSSYRLAVLLDSTKTQADLLVLSTSASGEDAITVSFEKDSDGSVYVHPKSSSGLMPNVSKAKNELNAALYGEDGSGGSAQSTMPSIVLDKEEVPESLTFDEAYEEGIVMLISTYMTEYSTGTAARDNRNFNIHRCADLINNTICKANGGKWSFNDTTGECNEAAGFKSAGIIQDGVYTDSFGGGICQVATTVFNSVYEAGYPVPVRFNHSLYPKYYPRGRDAAVDYGGYNLIWENDSSSDVLVCTSYTEDTITVDLYGISPRLHVETTVSDWEDGKEYGQTIYVDESLNEGTDYIKSQGQNGGSLVTTRYVYNSSNVLIRTDNFKSNYDPQDEVRIIGPGEEASRLLATKKATLLTEEILAHL